ncbi:hypothetical protein PFLUV_G00143430 [Perca fluviatilis]|uniref:Uncharacterized protein n=1 Tax=Perca fluviatilis TaxID=8168 RepID=A0A6A5F1F6_PERFL|nr:hypothetical protein PFLUV_G00143430 [Perca fluviatilis]
MDIRECNVPLPLPGFFYHLFSATEAGLGTLLTHPSTPWTYSGNQTVSGETRQSEFGCFCSIATLSKSVNE